MYRVLVITNRPIILECWRLCCTAIQLHRSQGHGVRPEDRPCCVGPGAYLFKLLNDGYPLYLFYTELSEWMSNMSCYPSSGPQINASK
jgi:hypothetical protein